MTFLAALFLAAVMPRVDVPYLGLMVVEADTGRIMMEDKADKECYPASCTKLMTLLLALESIDRGEISLADTVPTTSLSARELPSISGIRHPGGMKLSDLLKVLMVKSANDGAVMIAEHVAGAMYKDATNSQQRLARFIDDMNVRARELGMRKTFFTSPNGYPPKPPSKRKFDTSSARDMAVLGLELAKREDVFRYTSLRSCSVKDTAGHVHSYGNHNRILSDPRYRLEGVDGFKTGYHDAGGSSLLLTAKNNQGKRVILSIMGCRRRVDRDTTARKIMEDALISLSF